MPKKTEQDYRQDLIYQHTIVILGPLSDEEKLEKLKKWFAEGDHLEAVMPAYRRVIAAKAKYESFNPWRSNWFFFSALLGIAITAFLLWTVFPNVLAFKGNISIGLHLLAVSISALLGFVVAIIIPEARRLRLATQTHVERKKFYKTCAEKFSENLPKNWVEKSLFLNK